MLPAYKQEEQWIKCIQYKPQSIGKKADNLYYIKQRLSGLVMVVIGIMAPFLLDGDATFTLVTLPLGILLLWTKERVMMFQLKTCILFSSFK